MLAMPKDGMVRLLFPIIAAALVACGDAPSPTAAAPDASLMQGRSDSGVVQFGDADVLTSGGDHGLAYIGMAAPLSRPDPGCEQPTGGVSETMQDPCEGDEGGIEIGCPEIVEFALYCFSCMMRGSYIGLAQKTSTGLWEDTYRFTTWGIGGTEMAGRGATGTFTLRSTDCVFSGPKTARGLKVTGSW